MSKVMIVDDDLSVTKALQRGLSHAGFDVEMYFSAQEFLTRDALDEPGCVVLDLELPELNGLEVQRQLRADAALPIIFLTAHASVAASVEAMKQGAFEFLVKPVDLAILIDAVERALAASANGLDLRNRRTLAEKGLARLTPRERQVADLVAAGSTNKQIATQLGASEKTVKIHRGRAMHKLEIHSVAELVRIVDRVEARKSQA